MKRTLILAAACGLALTACSTTVEGHGVAAGNAPAATDNPTDSPSDTAGSPSASASAAPSGGGDSSDRTSLSCKGGQVISPKGSPYCYVLPAGTGVHQLTDVVLPGGGQYTSAIGFGGRDVIAVTVFRTQVDTDDLGDTDLQQATDQVVNSQLSGDFTIKTKTGERLDVDNARALHYHGVSKKDPFDIDFYFVYRAMAKVQVNCQFKDHKAQIGAACAKLLNSLQFKTVH